MTDNYRDEMREALETTAEALELALARLGVCGEGDGKGRKADADSFGGTKALALARAALSRLSAQAEPAKDAREFVRDWIVANHGVLSMAGTAAQDLIVRLQARLSASGQGDTCIGCEHDGEQDKWRPCSSCARNSHDNYESRKS